MRAVVLLACVIACAVAAYSPTIVPVTGYTTLKTSNQSTFYSIDAPQSDYGIPVYLVDLKGRFVKLEHRIFLLHCVSTSTQLLFHIGMLLIHS